MINLAIGIIILAAAGILVTIASVQKANDSLLRKIEDEEQMEWIRQYCNKKEGKNDLSADFGILPCIQHQRF